jgi:hypothetical protein
VCGGAWEKQETLLVKAWPPHLLVLVGRTVLNLLCLQDVHAFPGHIACDSASNSEIVVPIISPITNVHCNTLNPSKLMLFGIADTLPLLLVNRRWLVYLTLTAQL